MNKSMFRKSSRLTLCLMLITLCANCFAEQGAGDETGAVDHSMHDSSESSMDHSEHAGHSMSQEDESSMDHSQHSGHDHSDHKMTLDDEGMVMNWNEDQLPTDCQSISKEYQFTVKAGVKYAKAFNDTVFGFDQHEFHVEPCSKVTVTFTNEDKIRHQWMMHGLPKYIYQQGMFHLEAAGGATKVGTFIVPSDNKTYLVHCDIAQHMENGMKSQLVVGKGSGNLSSIPGITGSIWPDQYPVSGGLIALVAALLLGFVSAFVLVRKVSS